MWLKLDVLLQGHLADKATGRVMVNSDHVVKITEPHTASRQGTGYTKVVLVGGETLQVTQSYEWIEGTIEGTLDKGYEAPEPKLP